ncbi:transcriptional regulator [Cylindrospermopsis raciborskii S07]|uniref:Transcriptional regulator n=1 Tax=Cylindrospermopsis raciborskii CS-505 TaxID=533240 RepID=A0A853MA47_9CYAN|nr:LCP family protein [Cylindrospermopsis raciborskii]EFA70539.1 conR (Cell envelope-related transcriptional attenuator) [Cylindrospermopsis raciborskii CS-505]OBU75345.1 transcriptional regulator [Cylindrospermopsis raciborskii CS-505]PNK04571.1 transcriptional regulator [Cylindrospermopsis raciborskii S07]PNK08553.1 transcriptional regulator [Cylindrospermopsis raciborskii S10]PNK11145.1 transcriptional regulator [Cylindrospermopsis raciborskii S14]
MIKQVQWLENQLAIQQVTALEHEGQLEQFMSVETQTVSNPVLRAEVTAGGVNSQRTVAELMGSMPYQISDKLGLSMPRWLLWVLTFSISITLSGLFMSAVALWTPLWSNLEKAEDDGFTPSNRDTLKVSDGLWNKLSLYQLSKPMNILVMGVEPIKGTLDGSPESFAGSSDTMLLVRLNPSDKSIRVLSIPKGTMVSLPEDGLSKISEANTKGGPVLAARAISRAFSNAPIDRYIRISTSGLRELVDQLGGVDIFVPQSMSSQEQTGGTPTNLVSGWQTLDGEQAELFARFRESSLGDIARVQRQQALIGGLVQRLNNPVVLPRLPQLTRMMRKYFDTNLRMEEMMALANFAVNVERDNFQMTMLPGTFSKFSKDPESYWLNLTGQQSLLKNYVGVDIYQVKSDSRSVSQLKIAIQNASSQPQVTAKVINQLKSKGFANIYTVPDWAENQRQTQIFVRRGTRQPGVELQTILGRGQIEVSAQGDLDADLTIRIGEDWK